MTISSWLNLVHPATPGRGSAAGRKSWLRLTTASARCLRLLWALFSLFSLASEMCAVGCPAMTHYDVASGQCVTCSSDHYQALQGQVYCVPCQGHVKVESPAAAAACASTCEFIIIIINIRLIMAWQNAGQIQRMNNMHIHKYSVSKHSLGREE